MKRCVIIGGAGINEYDRVRRALREDDYYVFCDSGLMHAEKLGVRPDLIVGDFDSYERPDCEAPDAEVIELPREKDDTDTFFAAKEMVRRGFEEFLLVGVIGARLDHTLANVSILLMLDTQGKKAKAIDDFGELEILSASSAGAADGRDGTAFIDDSYSYFSVINITGEAEGVTIRNAKFPVQDVQISWDYQYAVSNEVLPGKVAEVSVRKGRLLLIKIF